MAKKNQSSVNAAAARAAAIAQQTARAAAIAQQASNGNATNAITPAKPNVITPIKPVVTPVKPIIPSVVLKPAVIQQANMELSNGSMEQALNTLKSAEQEAVNGLSKHPQGSTETKGEPSWPEEPEYDDYEDNETETTDDKPSNLKWWLIGGIGGALLITAIVVIIIVAKRKK